MEDKLCFTAIEFCDDPNVIGNLYWYLCPFAYAKAGDYAVAPLGRHNRLQKGIIRKVLFAQAEAAPYPLYLIKSVKSLVFSDGGTTLNMFEIVKKRALNPSVTMMDIYAPLVAKKALAGQFIILRADSEGERIPLTVAGYDRVAGTVKIIFQVVGGTTMRLNAMGEGDCLADFVGPLGAPSETDGVKSVCVVGGGVGCAIALPVAQRFKELGARVHSIVGFRNKELVILEEEFSSCSDKLTLLTDDGSYKRKGLVTEPLKEALSSGEKYDKIVAIGPIPMMKFVVATAKPFGVPVTVSMNPIMIDGTGMCGGCRLIVGGKPRFACVDGPEFDGYEVDFDSAAMRLSMYSEFEKREREACCNLFRKEGN